MIEWLKFPLFIKWYITGKCNLRCKHCYLSNYNRELPLSSIKNFIQYCAKNNLKEFCLLGGEPLMRQDLEEILYEISNYGINNIITTNGTLLNKERCKSLFNNGGLYYQISLEGPNSILNDAVRGSGNFNKTIKGIENLKTFKTSIAVQMTISKKNIKYIEEFHRICLELGVDKIRFAAFMPLGTGEGFKNDFLLNRSDVLVIRDILMTLYSEHPKLLIESPFIKSVNTSENTFGCGAGTTTAVVNSDATLSACDLLAEKDFIRFDFNNVEKFSYIWNESIFFNKWRGNFPKKFLLQKSHGFKNVHKTRCHLSQILYNKDLFC